jgi:hypothetical protein
VTSQQGDPSGARSAPTAVVRTLAGDQCTVHAGHRPPVLETELHHVMPRGMGGPDVAGNRVPVCGTGHANIHCALRDIIRGRKPRGTRAEVSLARRGYEEWVAAGKPGRPE